MIRKAETMAIYKTLSRDDFEAEFRRSPGRDKYSVDGYNYLYEYYSELSEGFELDVIVVCGEWTEYDNMHELLVDTGYEDCDSIREFWVALPNGHYLINQ